MYGLKRTILFFVATSLLAGFAVDTYAQTFADPQGVRIRVNKDNEWVKIGEKFEVRVLTRGITLTNVIVSVAAPADTVGAPQNAVSALTGDMFTAGLANDGANDGRGTLTSDDIPAFDADGDDPKTGVSTSGIETNFTFVFPVAHGDGESAGPQSLMVQVFVVEQGQTAYKMLHNQMTEQESAVFSDRVGDGKMFGVDGQRPLNGAIFDSVVIDRTALKAVGNAQFLASAETLADGNTVTHGTTQDTVFSAKQGDRVTITVHTRNILGSGATMGQVHIVDADSAEAWVVDPDNAYWSKTYTSRELLFGIRETFTVADGASGNQKKAFGDRRRVKLIAFLVDLAGNQSANENTDGIGPQPYYGNVSTDATVTDAEHLVYIVDSEKPTVTMTRPKEGTTDADSLRFTARDTVAIVIRDAGDTDATPFDDTVGEYSLMPMTLRVDEPLQSASITLGDTTITVALAADSLAVSGGALSNPMRIIGTDGTPNDPATTRTNMLTALMSETPSEIEFDVGVVKEPADGGNTIEVKVVVKDAIGNETTETTAGALFDVVPPGFNEIFPNSDEVPTNEDNNDAETINPATYQPSVRTKEALDSLVVRYAQLDGSDDLVYGVPRGHSILANVDREYTVAFGEKDTLLDATVYTLQLVAFDLAGNVSATELDTLTFTKGFNNPQADSFTVEVDAESVIAGNKIAVTVTAIDSALSREAGTTRRAVEYSSPALLTVQASDLSGLTIDGDSRGVTDNGDGTATLDGEGWSAGKRTVTISSTVALSDVSVTVADITAGTVNFRGDKGGLTFDAGEFSQYSVTALEDKADGTKVETDRVSGDFTLMVVPTDKHGNKSLKNEDVLDSNVGDPDTVTVKEILFTFSTNIGGAGGVPQGQQSIKSADGLAFIAGAPDRRGSGLVITVTSAENYGVGGGPEVGSTAALSFVPFGEDPTRPPPSLVPLPVDTVVVQDYWGADGQGDQGGFVLITFPNSETHAGATYRVYREIMVSNDLASGGGLEDIAPANRWMAWAKIDAVPVFPGGSAVTRAVVPVVDAGPAVATRWAIGVERGGLTSASTVAGKRVFTRESVQQMVRLLGVDPNRVISQADLEKLITPPKDYVKSILGDRKGIVFAGLDPDPGNLLTQISVPSTIRTDSDGTVTSSALTVSEPAAALDNIPPTAVTGSSGSVTSEGEVNLAWTPSVDDKVVGTIVYNGHHIPIDGVRHYEIMRGTDAASLEAVAIVQKGSGEYVDANLPDGNGLLFYRIDALDLDNRTPGAIFEVSTGRQRFFVIDPATGATRECFVMEFTNTPYSIDFFDFVAFASAFEKSPGQPGYTVQADTNDDGNIDFADFVNFVSCFDMEVAGGMKRAVPTRTPGVNDDVELSMSLDSERVVAGETISVAVSLANVEALTAYGLSLSYDPDRFEFVEAVPADGELLKSTGGDTPLFKTFQTEAGELKIANAVVHGSSVSGEGPILNVTFKVLREFEDMARFEIADGIVFDPESHSNPVVMLGALEVQSTPAEFALLQNYPNPFNPETTIKYNLAESGDVRLRIYNIVGQVVRTLVAELQPAGRYEVRWAGRDDRGMAVSSGIYFYQLTAGSFQDVKRLMLLK